MPEERADVLERRSGPSTSLGCRVTKNVAPDLAQASGLRVAPQVPVERGVRDGEGASAIGPDGPASGRGRGEGRLPGRLRQLAAPDCAALRADLVPCRSSAR
jgi:hypothetical protein